MPLFQTDDQIVERVNNPANVLIKLIGAGRPIGSLSHGPNKKLDTDTKAFIGTLATVDSTKSAAKAFDISPSQVSAMKNGTMKNNENIEVVEKIATNLKATRTLAIDKLVGMMETMTPEKMKQLPILQAAIAAEKLAGVHEKLSGKTNGNQINAGVIYYAPRTRNEDQYPILEAEVVSR